MTLEQKRSTLTDLFITCLDRSKSSSLNLFPSDSTHPKWATNKTQSRSFNLRSSQSSLPTNSTLNSEFDSFCSAQLAQLGMKEVVFAFRVGNGSPKELMKLYQYLFCEYSPVISAEVTGKHQVELAGKEDKPFMECVYRLIRDMFDYVPKLTRDQFFSASYAQVKATMAIEIIDLVQKKLKTPPTAGSSSSSSSSTVSSAPSALLSSTHDGPLNTSGSATTTTTTSSGSSGSSMPTKTSKSNLKSEHSFKNGVSKPSTNHHLPPKASRVSESSID